MWQQYNFINSFINSNLTKVLVMTLQKIPSFNAFHFFVYLFIISFSSLFHLRLRSNRVVGPLDAYDKCCI